MLVAVAGTTDAEVFSKAVVSVVADRVVVEIVSSVLVVVGTAARLRCGPNYSQCLSAVACACPAGGGR